MGAVARGGTEGEGESEDVVVFIIVFFEVVRESRPRDLKIVVVGGAVFMADAFSFSADFLLIGHIFFRIGVVVHGGERKEEGKRGYI